ncbi:nitrate reductase associated protein [Chryseolinea lacunae]|uniref:Nitrate reductase associated protein n=1 Tax=Chryseolinea lacunae TaxID=2801331 RepID=A0ABS1KZ83_9BACT|nr:nitrate reductase associated protein [Chryseolinea lacunae]MBL0744781.1 nitrate reductase associated protein [Chryseolinea lacunae]
MTINRNIIEYFRFEEDFVEDNVRCIPMIVRFKLDAAGVKLKLAEWSKMTPHERERLATLSCETEEEISIYQRYLKHLVWHRTGQEATPLQVQANPAWSVLSTLPELLSAKLSEVNQTISLLQWQRLSVLQRFALLKLSSGGHEHKNFQKALEEFELV